MSKGINGLRQTNKLLSKGMKNIYLKVNEKNWRSQNFDFQNLKKL